MDSGLAAEFRGNGLYRQAIGLFSAVTAALADPFIDEHALGRCDHLLAFAFAAQLRGAGLVVDQYRDAGDPGQLPLRFVEPVTMAQLDAMRQSHALVARRVVRRYDDLCHALGNQFGNDLGHALTAHDVLPSGHSDGAVDEQFVGDVRTRRDAGAYGQAA